MTREEAIQRFNGIIRSMSISVAQAKFYPTKAELDELCDMAIEALSAEAVQEAVPTVVRVTMSDGSQYYLEHERDAIQADTVQGEWIEREDWNGDYYYDCSVCGESFVLCDGTPSMNLYHFCPNCGSKMKGESHEP